MSNKSDTTNGNQEQSFTTLPHPARTNDPADLQGKINPHGLQQGELGAFNGTPGPVIPNTLPEPRSHEELEIAQKQLNQAQPNSKQ